jgi:hypothetical protein
MLNLSKTEGEKTMSDDPIKIKITKVFGGDDSDKNELKDCYFTLSDVPGNYHFHGKHDNPIATIPEVLTSDSDFQFIRAGMLWTVSEFHVDPVKETAHGHWNNPRHVDDDDGEFHAQAGPGAEETASSAKA